MKYWPRRRPKSSVRAAELFLVNLHKTLKNLGERLFASIEEHSGQALDEKGRVKQQLSPMSHGPPPPGPSLDAAWLGQAILGEGGGQTHTGGVSQPSPHLPPHPKLPCKGSSSYTLRA